MAEIIGLDSKDAKNQESLSTLERHWLNAAHTVMTAEHLYEFTNELKNDVCNALGDSEKCLGVSPAIACLPWPLFYICTATKLATSGITFAILVVATIVYHVIDDNYVLGTMSDKEAYYGQYYSRANYINTHEYNKKNWEALHVINSNMKDQHKEMKRQLQERHKEIANHVGEDIADTQNALGQAIVDAQNNLGQAIVGAQNDIRQGIVNTQNDIGKAIVDAQNALGQDIVGELYFRPLMLGRPA